MLLSPRSSAFVLAVVVVLAGCASTGNDCVVDTDCPLGRYCGAGECVDLGTQPGNGPGDPDDEDCLRGPGGICLDRDGSTEDGDGSVAVLPDGSVSGDGSVENDGGVSGFDAGPFDGSVSGIEDADIDASGPPPVGVRREGEIVAETSQWRTVDDRDPPRITIHRRRVAQAALYETSDLTECTPVPGMGACTLFRCDTPPRQDPRSAGSIDIIGSETVTLTPSTGGYETQMSESSDHWSTTGGTIRFRAPGSIVPPIDETFPAPEQVRITAPDFRSRVRLNLTSGTDFRWEGAPNGEVVIRLEANAAGFEGTVECRFPASAGRGRVSLGLLATGIPSGTTGTIDVYNEVSRTPELPAFWEVSLKARARAIYTSDSQGSTREVVARPASL